MWHVDVIEDVEGTLGLTDQLKQKATGAFYTDLRVAECLAHQLVALPQFQSFHSGISVADPFCGDGRLVVALLRAMRERDIPLRIDRISLWDLDPNSVSLAERSVREMCLELGMEVTIETRSGDAFTFVQKYAAQFDCIVTNPPWDILKPDPRDIGGLSANISDSYISNLRGYDKFLASLFPHSQPKRKFAGWGTNLARVGLEASSILLKQGGLLGIVSPASILADDMSGRLRCWLFEEKTLLATNYYPAEARLYAIGNGTSNRVSREFWRVHVFIPDGIGLADHRFVSVFRR